MMDKGNMPKISKANLLLVISLISLGYGEQFGLRCLFWFGVVMTCLVLPSALLAAYKYAFGYSFKKSRAKKLKQ